MAGRKPRVLQGPFADFLAHHGVSPAELAQRLGKHIQCLYRIVDGNAKRYVKLASEIATAVGATERAVLDAIHKQSETVAVSAFKQSVDTLGSFIAGREMPSSASATTLGPSREQLIALTNSLQRWLDAGYGKRPSTLPPKRLTRPKAPPVAQPVPE